MSIAASSDSTGTSGAHLYQPPGRAPKPLRFSQLPARKKLRTARKLILILVGTAVLASGMLVLWIPTLLVPSRRERWQARIRRPVFRVWGLGMLFTLGVRLRSEGTPPPPGSLIVSNHLSYLDISTLACLLPAVFVSKAEVQRWPFWGTMASMGGTIFIDRGKKRDTVRVLSEMGAALNAGDSVIVFPEATSTDGASIIPFKSSLLATAGAEGIPVHWLTINYEAPDAGASARDQVCWWGDMEFLPHFLGLCALRRVNATVHYGDAPLVVRDRKQLAADLRQRMLTTFTPTS